MSELAAKTAQSHWMDWCRLCAKVDVKGNFSVFCKTENSNPDTQLATAIGKYFWVNIKLDENMPQKLCVDCNQLIAKLCKFTERINKVQTLYTVLSKLNIKEAANAYKLRRQFDILDESSEHIMAAPAMQHVGVQTEPIQSEDMVGRMISGDCSETQLSDLCFKYDNDGDDSVDASKPIPNNTQEAERAQIKIVQQQDEKMHIQQTNNKMEIEDVEDYKDAVLNVAMEYDEQQDHYIINMRDIEESSDCEQYEQHYETEADKDDNENDGEEPKLENAVDDATNNADEDNENEFQQTTTSIEIATDIETKYVCKICAKSYKNATSYRKHMSILHSIKSALAEFQCDKCGRNYPTVKQLETHKRTHLPLEEKAIVPCPNCEKKFTKTSVMLQHVSSIHCNSKPFVCDECGRCLKTAAALNEHKLVHTNECPFECEICQKSFKNKARLKVHMDTHTETNYNCEICSATLNTRRTLRMHMLVHTDIKQFQCPFCNTAFKRSKALKNHLILHNGLRPYACNFCDKRFSNGSNCRSHKKKAHPKELAELEAQGQKTEPTTVPKIDELKSPTQITNARVMHRSAAGLTPTMRALILDAEQSSQNCETPENAQIILLNSVDVPIESKETLEFEIIEEA